MPGIDRGSSLICSSIARTADRKPPSFARSRATDIHLVVRARAAPAYNNNWSDYRLVISARLRQHETASVSLKPGTNNRRLGRSLFVDYSVTGSSFNKSLDYFALSTPDLSPDRVGSVPKQSWFLVHRGFE